MHVLKVLRPKSNFMESFGIWPRAELCGGQIGILKIFWGQNLISKTFGVKVQFLKTSGVFLQILKLVGQNHNFRKILKMTHIRFRLIKYYSEVIL